MSSFDGNPKQRVKKKNDIIRIFGKTRKLVKLNPGPLIKYCPTTPTSFLGGLGRFSRSSMSEVRRNVNKSHVFN